MAGLVVQKIQGTSRAHAHCVPFAHGLNNIYTGILVIKNIFIHRNISIHQYIGCLHEIERLDEITGQPQVLIVTVILTTRVPKSNQYKASAEGCKL